MITRNRMKFMEGNSDGFGGSVAVAEPPPAMTPLAEIYNKSLAEAQGEKHAPSASGPTGPAGTTGATGHQDVSGPSGPAASGATGPAPKEKPASALDAVLDDAPASTVATGPAVADENEFLNELPETLPREGRGAHWEKARGAIKTQGATISQLTKESREKDAKIQQLETAPPKNSDEVAALQKQLDEYKDAVVAINVEYDPEHRKKFVDGRSALISKAAVKLDAFGGKGELIKSALEMSEGRGRTQAIKEALADLEPVEQNRVLQFVGEVEKLDDEKAEIMKDPQGAWNKLQKSQSDARQVAAQQAEEYKKTVFESVSKTLPSKIFLLRPVDSSLPDATEHNAAIEQIKADAFKLLQPDAKPEDLVEAAYAKQVVPKLQQFLIDTRAELKAARAALKEYEGAEPGFRGGKPKAKSEAEQKLDKTPGQLFTESLRESRSHE
jgi:uncharacterized protein (UPF0335 family)